MKNKLVTKRQILWVVEQWSTGGWTVCEVFGIREKAREAMHKLRWDNTFQIYRIVAYRPVEDSYTEPHI